MQSRYASAVQSNEYQQPMRIFSVRCPFVVAGSSGFIQFCLWHLDNVLEGFIVETHCVTLIDATGKVVQPAALLAELYKRADPRVAEPENMFLTSGGNGVSNA